MILREILSIWPNDESSKTLMLDIGANLGIHGLYVANLGFRVWAVEPQVPNLIKVVISIICYLKIMEKAFDIDGSYLL